MKGISGIQHQRTVRSFRKCLCNSTQSIHSDHLIVIIFLYPCMNIIGMYDFHIKNCTSRCSSILRLYRHCPK